MVYSVWEVYSSPPLRLRQPSEIEEILLPLLGLVDSPEHTERSESLELVRQDLDLDLVIDELSFILVVVDISSLPIDDGLSSSAATALAEAPKLFFFFFSSG